jgi:restriction system protein
MTDVEYGNCGLVIDSESPNLDPSARQPCPRCGSLSRRFVQRLSGSLAPAGRVSVTPALARLNLSGHAPTVQITAADSLGTSVAEDISVQDVVGAHVGSSAELFPPGVAPALPEMLLQAAVVNIGGKTTEGQLIVAAALPWFEVVRHLQRDPSFLYKIHWRQLEEIIADAYKREGWPEVVLTPRSGDGGRDIVANWPGVGSIRILDQIKAYRPGHVVDADKVRAMLGVLEAEQNVSKGLVTTTSTFAPGIGNDGRLARFMPYRLELKNGQELLRWLTGLIAGKSSN